MNTKNKNSSTTNEKKYMLIALTVLSVIFSLGTHFCLINSSIMYYIFDKFTSVALFIFPLLALSIVIFSSIIIFKKSKISYIIPVAISLIGCLLAFALADSSFSSKIQSDFLKNENLFNDIIKDYESNNVENGTYEIDKKELKFVVPEQKIIIESVGNGNKKAYFIVAVDIEDRYEGYVFDPYGSPPDWLENGEFSEPLDIEQKWSYFVYHKGASYD